MIQSTHNLAINRAVPQIMHIDINSCFATIEQQANPSLRGKPVVVTASPGDYGCILAASIEAKRSGVKTGMRLKEAKGINPHLAVLPTDPDKYRFIHHALKKVLSAYTPDITPKSIDEFSLNFSSLLHHPPLMEMAHEIKARIRAEVGSHISVSIGIGSNRFLAKTAAELHKPDGLDSIDHQNIQVIFNSLQLTDLCGISIHNAIRLHEVGINTATDFLNASMTDLKAAFRSITATYWFMRLHGWEIDSEQSKTQGFSNSYVLPHSLPVSPVLLPVMGKLVHKLSSRLRENHYQAKSLFISLLSSDHQYWHNHQRLSEPMNSTTDFLKAFNRLIRHTPFKEVKKIMVACGDLQPAASLQLCLFENRIKKDQTALAMDDINHRFGDYTLTSAQMINTTTAAPDAIAFGKM